MKLSSDLAEIEKAVGKLDGVIIANQNSTTQAVLAGSTEAVKRAEEELTLAGYKVTPLPVSAAFHTPLVEHASIPFAKAVSQEKFQKPQIPVFSNTTGKEYPLDTDQIQEILSNHILNPVVFKTKPEKGDYSRMFRKKQKGILGRIPSGGFPILLPFPF